MSRHKPHLDPATGAPRHPLPDTFAETGEVPDGSKGAILPDWQRQQLDRLLEALSDWRNKDHEEAVTLARSDVCALLDGFYALEYRSVIPAVPQTPLWQPIETAPKDGTTVILADDSDPMMAVIGFWQSGDWLVDWDHERFNDPTRWMPIPAYSLSRPNQS